MQLDRYLEERAAGLGVLEAADRAGLGEAEALLTEKAIESGDLELPRAGARARARESEPQTGAAAMAQETTTISINGGPKHTIEEVREALDIVRSRHGDVAAEELRLLIERIERIEEERKGLAEDIRDVYAEAKSRGFDKSAMKQCIKLRRMGTHKLQEAEAVLHAYMDALGLNAFESSAALGIVA